MYGLRIFHCTKCGAESPQPFVLGLAGYGRVCYECYQKGNKDDGRAKRNKEMKKLRDQKTKRLGIEGRGLVRFA